MIAKGWIAMCLPVIGLFGLVVGSPIAGAYSAEPTPEPALPVERIGAFTAPSGVVVHPEIADLFVSESGERASVTLAVHKERLVIRASFDGLYRNVRLAVRGRLFRVDNMYRRLAPEERSQGIGLVSEAGSPESKLIVSKDQSLFLPVAGSMHVHNVIIVPSLAARPETDDGNPCIKLAVSLQSTKFGAKLELTDEQRVQHVRKGDVIAYGDRGLRIRRIVLPDPAKKILGWIEVEDREVAVAR